MNKLKRLYYSFPEAAAILNLTLEDIIHFAETGQISFSCLGDWEFLETREKLVRQITTLNSDEFSTLVAGNKVILAGKVAEGTNKGMTAKITMYPDHHLWIIDGDTIRAFQSAHHIAQNKKQIMDNAPAEHKKTRDKERDKEQVQEIGKRLLDKYGITLTTASTKRSPELKPFYKDYSGKGPVIVDEWLCEIGVRKSKRGRPAKSESDLIP